MKLEGAELEEHKAKQRLKEAEEARIKAEKEKRLVSSLIMNKISKFETVRFAVSYIDKQSLKLGLSVKEITLYLTNITFRSVSEHFILFFIGTFLNQAI